MAFITLGSSHPHQDGIFELQRPPCIRGVCADAKHRVASTCNVCSPSTVQYMQAVHARAARPCLPYYALPPALVPDHVQHAVLFRWRLESKGTDVTDTAFAAQGRLVLMGSLLAACIAFIFSEANS